MKSNIFILIPFCVLLICCNEPTQDWEKKWYGSTWVHGVVIDAKTNIAIDSAQVSPGFDTTEDEMYGDTLWIPYFAQIAHLDNDGQHGSFDFWLQPPVFEKFSAFKRGYLFWHYDSKKDTVVTVGPREMFLKIRLTPK